MIEDKVLQMARNAMLDNIEALSIEELRSELKKHLQNEFDEVDKNKRFKEFLDNLYKEMTETPADNMDQELQKLSCLAVLDTVLQQFNTIYQK